ncbi:MAG: hypothetical protein HRU18_11245 [Pseudoalteromonas sp.]|uniref:hypothetical protein n=1 Tax=Pseudoalteromonas sp. TaxID=53249 RepID=UPI001D3A3A3D|nr:hypothetical protein [Pseudoalteromonas sp.]NRA78775.1 hypothetical protein [Pseudoalteromonas sp.]
MIVIIDGDGLVWSSAFNQDSLKIAKDKFVEKVNDVLNAINDDVDIDEVIMCNGSKNNFRKSLNSSYKANRKSTKPKLLGELHEWVKEEYNSYWGDGVETDDVVATLWKKIVDENGVDSCLIVSQDKDYKQFNCWYFDHYYKRFNLSKISKEDALRNFYTQMIVGDSADNVNYCKGYGLSYCNKVFENVTSEFGYIRRVYYLYKKLYEESSKDKFIECYKLLKLKTDSDSEIRRGL